MLSCFTVHPRAKTADDYGCKRELRKYCRRHWGSPLSSEYWRLAASLFWNTVFSRGFEGKRLRAANEIASKIPDGGTFILVDDDNLGIDEAIGNRRRIPFLERNGQYWGRPPDDETAIRELERLRNTGAAFMVFAWPAFWWLEHYSGLHQHLRSRFRRTLKNPRLIVFDLRDAALTARSEEGRQAHA